MPDKDGRSVQQAGGGGGRPPGPIFGRFAPPLAGYEKQNNVRRDPFVVKNLLESLKIQNFWRFAPIFKMVPLIFSKILKTFREKGPPLSKKISKIFASRPLARDRPNPVFGSNRIRIQLCRIRLLSNPNPNPLSEKSYIKKIFSSIFGHSSKNIRFLNCKNSILLSFLVYCSKRKIFWNIDLFWCVFSCKSGVFAKIIVILPSLNLDLDSSHFTSNPDPNPNPRIRSIPARGRNSTLRSL